MRVRLGARDLGVDGLSGVGHARLRASRLDNRHDAEVPRCCGSTCSSSTTSPSQPLDAADITDVYELIVERHRSAATVVSSNREPVEWLGAHGRPAARQSAIDWLQSAAYELVLAGESYRCPRSPDSRLLTRPRRPTIIPSPTLIGPDSAGSGHSISTLLRAPATPTDERGLAPSSSMCGAATAPGHIGDMEVDCSRQ